MNRMIDEIANGCMCDYESVMNAPLRALSVRQPWAALSAVGIKTVETRTWATSLRGLYMIHASGQRDYQSHLIMKADQRIVEKYCDVKTPNGAIIAVAELIDCVPMLPEHETAACCRCHPGLFAHVISAVFPVEPVPMKGKLNYFKTDLTLKDLKSLSGSKMEKLIAGENYF